MQVTLASSHEGGSLHISSAAVRVLRKHRTDSHTHWTGSPMYAPVRPAHTTPPLLLLLLLLLLPPSRAAAHPRDA